MSLVIGAKEAPGRLLVVDDNEMNRDMLSRRLKRQGYDVGMAVDGREALDMLGQGGFDLVLLDIMMPEMDGYEVLGRLKADAVMRHIPVIMISAVGETESVVRCIEMGADDYLPKPFNPTLLQARVGASLDKKKLRDRERLYAASLHRELEIGREIQRGFFPEQLPQIEGWEIAARFRPARSVAGDFYDCFSLRDGTLIVTIADVCDKGVGAALYMALFRTLLRVVAAEQPDGTAASDVIHRAAIATNDYIATTHSSSNMFATAFIAAIDPSTGFVSYVNAGHDAPIVVGPARRILGVTGPALGLMPGVALRVETTVLDRGETLFAFTDGVTEAKGDAGFFGEERIFALCEPSTAKLLLDSVEQSVAAFVGEHEASDDITMIAIRRE
jgi:phosphoserine phosphatase RsbU/P